MNKLAFVFPGQGSQALGMLADLAESQPQVRETFTQASAILGYDLWQLVQAGPEEDLNRTDYTQPAMLAAGVAVWRVWRAAGGQCPAFMAGHSLGEYTAWVCAGAIEFEAAVGLVADRGRYMLEAVPQKEGAMAAILGLSDEAVKNICKQTAQGLVIEAVNFNAPGQVVIAGHAEAVNRAVEEAREVGAKRAVTLSVSVPSHCRLMEPAAERLRQRLSDFAIKTPSIPVVNNVDVAVNQTPEAIGDALTRQLDHPVRWVETIAWLKSQGVSTLVECGPGKVLTGLIKRIDKSMAALPVHDPASLEKALKIVGEA
ncbi:malonyl CoA-acyl carrier protein transacylase [Nitrosococcus halophilus Nc 4]|uniref:Malonyl CoA-acyl carrier protein transacylase n=1 Tax=Nitrosococcus halophilus (strain Nc4) TaxID=472759 RepID=D5BZF4_NITHN|nr:ACP S-malonyltransferase [Nitrosococcus halophilus]ADE16168.1 malonyl CoA-acyl carrier protein transacylase [Nitrosococcus halophilus Nc 4]